MARFDCFRMLAIRSLLGANRTSRQSQNGANDPKGEVAQAGFRGTGVMEWRGAMSAMGGIADQFCSGWEM
jgi:hypothetical protein